MMQEGLLDGQQHSTCARGAVKKCLALGLAISGVALTGLAFYSSGPVPSTSGVISLATGAPSVEWVEVRSSSWNAAADKIIHRLQAEGVRRGQIISIDAHNTGPNDDAIFSAHFVRSWPDNGPLDITYHVQDEAYGWGTFYAGAASRVDETDIISITGSSYGNDRAVLYSFGYAPPAGNARVGQLKFVESRKGGWDRAAQDVIAQLKAAGVQRGQVVSIDAHNNGPTSDAIFVAFYDLSLPAFGELSISSHEMDKSSTWASFYNNAALKATTGVISITSSSNSGGYSVTFVFNYE